MPLNPCDATATVEVLGVISAPCLRFRDEDLARYPNSRVLEAGRVTYQGPSFSCSLDGKDVLFLDLSLLSAPPLAELKKSRWIPQGLDCSEGVGMKF